MVQNKTQSNSALKNGFNRIWNVKEIGIIVPTVIYAIFVQIINPVFFTPMGYEPVTWLNNFKTTGATPENVVNDSGTLVVTMANIDTYGTDMRDPTKW